MSRASSKRMIFTGKLVAKTPLAVGGMGKHAFLDAPLAADARGRGYIPGTSVAGPLRVWAEEHCSDRETFKRVFGYQNGDSGAAARLCIEDATIEGAAHIDVEDHVGIDRITGAAAHNIKFDQQVWLPGTAFSFQLELECSIDETKANAELALVDAVLAQLIAGGISFGSKSSRGQGQVALIELKSEAIPLAVKADFIRWLTQSFPQPHIPNAAATTANCDLKISIEFTAIQPLMLKASREGSSVKILPRFQRTGADQYQLVLPGSAITGPLRTRAEKIIRTLLDISAPNKFQDQTSIAIVKTLFGAARVAGANSAPNDELERKSPLRVAHCLAHSPCITAGQFNALGETQSAPLGFKVLTNVALDRWTQAPKDGALFSLLVPIPESTTWQPMQLTLSLQHVPEQYRKASVALLLHMLADLARGEIAFGFGTRRGMGAVKVDAIKVTAPDADGFAWLKSFTGNLLEKRFNEPEYAWLKLSGADFDALTQMQNDAQNPEQSHDDN